MPKIHTGIGSLNSIRKNIRLALGFVVFEAVWSISMLHLDLDFSFILISDFASCV